MKIIPVVISILPIFPICAQKLVDPDKVAPEYREAAEKRRTEQIEQLACARKANADNVLPRDRTGFIIHCLDEVAASKH